MNDEKKAWVDRLMQLGITKNSVARILDISVTSINNDLISKTSKIIEKAAVGDEYTNQEADKKIRETLEMIDLMHPFTKIRLISAIAEAYNPVLIRKEKSE